MDIGIIVTNCKSCPYSRKAAMYGHGGGWDYYRCELADKLIADDLPDIAPEFCPVRGNNHELVYKFEVI